MSPRSLFLMLAAVLGLGILTACALLSPEPSFAAKHPQQLGPGLPTCSACHSNEPHPGTAKSYASFDHTAAFVKDHRFQAQQDSGSCASCHSQSSCTACHGSKQPMKPSIHMANRPDRESPHRGDYLTRHRMDGKLDPSGCYKCHGRANNDKCRSCHT